MASTLPRLPVLEAIASHDPKSTAVIHSLSGRSFTYGDLLHDVASARARLGEKAQGKKQEGERIAFLVENSYDYVVTFLSILSSNAIAVPLSPGFPAGELRYILNQSEASMLLSSARYHDKAQEVTKEGLEHSVVTSQVDKIVEGKWSGEAVSFEGEPGNEGGLMLYTSGTTSRPKGVLLPNAVLTAQCRSLHEAWAYSPDDHLLHVLPLHHIHGTVNALLTPLFAGSTIEFLFPFNADAVWARFAAPFLPSSPPSPSPKRPITFFTVVPTIWTRLLQSHPNLSPSLQSASKTAINPSNLRLNISGSAALPTPTKQAWTALSSGNVLLERYGMTEVGMALSCGLAFADRIDGAVGWPLPTVQARLVDTDTAALIPPDSLDHPGEIHLRGPTIFSQYWHNPTATASDFVPAAPDDPDQSPWFKTGDVALHRHVPGAGTGASGAWATGPAYFIQGRRSADIIKTGGEKVSALEVEREMLALAQVEECAVVGVASASWGQVVAAVVVLSEEGKRVKGKGKEGKEGKEWSALDMRRAMKERLVGYKIPQVMRVVQEIPRNAMGKINKKELVKQVFGDEEMK